MLSIEELEGRSSRLADLHFTVSLMKLDLSALASEMASYSPCRSDGQR
jgi:hypothetical protein